MRRFTVFTLLYVAAGICLTAIAFQQPDLTPSLKKTLLVNAGLLYLFAVLSTFRDVIAQAVWGLTLILLCVEWLFTLSQIKS